jgi:hypothetical protein
MATEHAKNRPPSAAKRWLSCPFSATVAPLYGNEDTDASLKGDLWHEHMETRLTFGTLPVDCDPDAAEAMEELAEYVEKRFKECETEPTPFGLTAPRLLVEQRLEITETGEFGTGDVIILGFSLLEVIDEKSGYVPVDVKGNEQCLTYLCGAIDVYGPRERYRITIHQPNFDHADGPLRSWEPTEADIAAHRARLRWSMENPDHCEAGPHCKASYCDHRGACEAFRTYAQNDLALGWHPSELKGMDDASLAKALDASDELGGYRNELRAEAMRRIMNMDRKIDGYKVVKGRRNRAVRDPSALVGNVLTQLGKEWAARLFPDLTWVRDLPLEREEVLKQLGTPKHIEDVLKQYARVHNLPRGGWKQLYDNVVGEYIAETASGLTLERAIDGRPAHKRGSEFGVLDLAKPNNLNNVNIVL